MRYAIVAPRDGGDIVLGQAVIFARAYSLKMARWWVCEVRKRAGRDAMIYVPVKGAWARPGSVVDIRGWVRV